jgi:hypothetical protein
MLRVIACWKTRNAWDERLMVTLFGQTDYSIYLKEVEKGE